LKKKIKLASWQTFPKEKNTASPLPGKDWELMSNINLHTEFQSHDCQQLEMCWLAQQNGIVKKTIKNQGRTQNEEVKEKKTRLKNPKKGG
jgi:hypothetical protein